MEPGEVTRETERSQKETAGPCQVGGPGGLLAPFPKSRLEKLQRETGIPKINNKKQQQQGKKSLWGGGSDKCLAMGTFLYTIPDTQRALMGNMPSQTGHCHPSGEKQQTTQPHGI